MSFSVIALRTLHNFWTEHPESQEALQLWYKLMTKSIAQNFNELRETFGSVDYVPPGFIVFNIKGNHYRLITRVEFTYRTCYIKHVFTHREYDAWTPKRP